jgi:hypothetical protein
LLAPYSSRFADKNAPRLYDTVLFYLQYDVLKIKLKLAISNYFIVLIKQHTRHFILRADVTMENEVLIKLFVAEAYQAACWRLAVYMLYIACRQIRSVGSKSPANQQQIRVMWFELNGDTNV